MHGSNGHWKKNSSSLAAQSGAAELPCAPSRVSQRWHTQILGKGENPIIAGVLQCSGRIRSTTLTVGIPQFQFLSSMRMSAFALIAGAAPHCLCRRRWSDSEQPPPGRGEPRCWHCWKDAVPAAGISGLLSGTGRAVVSLVPAQKQQQEQSSDIGGKKGN